ncbi:hypothetical protein [Streptomyces rimosus]|uniref:hypothetical protein n=1 Tax=Streptomyces rimosus TaxID=1927 RepID=UPI001F51970D|nr:hypothetical protein [Streptomyces rimosus]
MHVDIAGLRVRGDPLALAGDTASPDWVWAETAAKVPSVMTSAACVRAVTEHPSGTTAVISTGKAPWITWTVLMPWNWYRLPPTFRSPPDTMTTDPTLFCTCWTTPKLDPVMKLPPPLMPPVPWTWATSAPRESQYRSASRTASAEVPDSSAVRMVISASVRLASLRTVTVPPAPRSWVSIRTGPGC